jgi:hypothetical protein
MVRMLEWCRQVIVAGIASFPRSVTSVGVCCMEPLLGLCPESRNTGILSSLFEKLRDGRDKTHEVTDRIVEKSYTCNV